MGSLTDLSLRLLLLKRQALKQKHPPIHKLKRKNKPKNNSMSHMLQLSNSDNVMCFKQFWCAFVEVLISNSQLVSFHMPSLY